MPIISMSAKLIAYLAATNLALRYSYRLCSHTNNRILSLSAPVTIISLLTAIVALLPMTTTLAVTILFIMIADGSPITILALNHSSGALGFTLWGAGLGFICVMLMFACGLAGKFITVHKIDGENRRERIPKFYIGLIDYIGGAIFEEVVLRGYIFYLLSSVFGGIVAIFVSSFIFSLLHLVRPDRIPAVFTLNAFIFGLLTGASRYYTGALWLPIGLHIGWNVTAGPILGLPYSGITYDRGIVRSEVKGPQWFTGGLYSPDAGLLGTIALAVAAVVLGLVAPII